MSLKASLIYTRTRSTPQGVNFQDLYNDEIIMASDKSTRFDATLEEVFHLICDYGYSQVNPKAFG